MAAGKVAAVKKNVRSNLMKQFFGTTKDGITASLFSLENSKGTRAEVTDYGASLVRFLFDDKNGIQRDLVLGYDDVSGYEKGEVFFGGTIGRVANRIGGGRFELGGKTYELTRNDGLNSLHGGRDLYNKRIWDVEEETASSVTFRLFSPDGDQGFPGNLNVTVCYSLSEDDELTIDYTAKADEDTPLSLCNHTYFNLAGHSSGSVLSQVAVIHADQVTEVDKNLVTTGKLISVDGTPFDFRKGKSLGQDIEEECDLLRLGGGYDHNFVISGSGYREAASLYCPETGISMKIFSDLPGMQVYTANMLTHENGKESVVYHQREGVCFETQFFPDAINKDNFEGGMIKAGEIFRSTTCYAFSV